MKKICIIGCGFAGIAALNRFRRSGLKVEVTIIDKKRTFDFLPMLPDVIGRGISPEYLAYEIEKPGLNFINEEAISLNLEKKEVATTGKTLSYDYLLVASGSETNFYGNDQIKKYAFTLDSAADAVKILSALKQSSPGAIVVSGGGYTGVELATNLRLFLDKNKRQGRIVIVERAPAILGPLPEWMKAYVAENFKRLKVEVEVNTSISAIEADKVTLSDGRIIDDAMLIWAAGVKTCGFIQALQAEKSPQGRIRADDCLRLNDSCFAAGDAAFFAYGGASLRMAVQFSITEGGCAAANIIRSIRGEPLRKYKPLDLGYVIPMANNRSCGRIMGINMRGFIPTVLHFLMCIYRSRGLRNRSGIIKTLLRGG